jgi:anti-sigma B factor antagonist
MEITSERVEDAVVLHLAGELTIYEVPGVKLALLDAMAVADGLEIDLSGVTEIDTAGVQLLVAAKSSANEQQMAMRLVGHSPVVLELIELYNLAGWFGDPLVLAAEGGVA